MKTIPAIVFTLVMTVLLIASMGTIGANALSNQQVVALTNTANLASQAKLSSDANAAANIQIAAGQQQIVADQQQIEQLQHLLSQYQDHENQYQAELVQAAQRINDGQAQLDQANQQNQTYQQVLLQLKQYGVIRITPDGQIQVIRGGGSTGGGSGGGGGGGGGGTTPVSSNGGENDGGD
jgi:hypothetical protein